MKRLILMGMALCVLAESGFASGSRKWELEGKVISFDEKTVTVMTWKKQRLRIPKDRFKAASFAEGQAVIAYFD